MARHRHMYIDLFPNAVRTETLLIQLNHNQQQQQHHQVVKNVNVDEPAIDHECCAALSFVVCVLLTLTVTVDYTCMTISQHATARSRLDSIMHELF